MNEGAEIIGSTPFKCPLCGGSRAVAVVAQGAHGQMIPCMFVVGDAKILPKGGGITLPSAQACYLCANCMKPITVASLIVQRPPTENNEQEES